MRQGVAHQAHAPEDQEHAERAAAQGQGQAGDQGVAHEDEFLEGRQKEIVEMVHASLRRQVAADSSQASDIWRASCKFSGVRTSVVLPQPMGSRAIIRVLGK
jgi:hypothetical protein